MDEPTTPHPGDELVDLALGNVDGRRRAELAAHLLACPGCRQDYDALSRAIADVVTEVPPVQPPVGFDAQVLRTIAAAEPTDAPTPRSPQAAGRRWLVAAAAAVLIVVAGVGALLALRATGGADELATVVPLRLDDGTAVGTVSLRDVDGEPVMVVALTDAPADVSYLCRMYLRDGSVVDAEAWPATPQGAWIVDVPATAADVDRVELVVSGTDRVWSSARL